MNSSHLDSHRKRSKPRKLLRREMEEKAQSLPFIPRKLKQPRLYTVEVTIPAISLLIPERHISLMLGVAFNLNERQALYDRFRHIQFYFRNAVLRSGSANDPVDKF